MTDIAVETLPKPDLSDARLRRRYRAERRFQMLGIGAIALALGTLALLLVTIVGSGVSAFSQTQIALDVTFSPELIDPQGTGDPAEIAKGDFRVVTRDALRELFPAVEGRRDRRALGELISEGALLASRQMAIEEPSVVGTTQRVWVLASADSDGLNKGSGSRLNEQQAAWFQALVDDGRVRTSFNTRFFTAADSREPELAGIRGAAVGSFWTLLVTLLLSFPIGVMAAIYLEEFAPKNRITDLIEVNINNLAAVPSIVFGLLGLAVLLNFLSLPRSAPLVGGIVLALMTLPTIIIAARAALKAVPPSIREGALAMGASPQQAVRHHVLPLAMPGILTGTIIGMAQALGETAPLLMIGMVAFIADVPQGITSPATVLPVQVFLWADAPERAFVERTSAAIMVLLSFLLVMNLTAVFLRKLFERRW